MITAIPSVMDPIVLAGVDIKTSDALVSYDGASAAIAKIEIVETESVEISPEAESLAKFYGAASDYVRQEYMKPFVGFDRGMAPSAYINIEKYNNYIFDRAASNFVDQAKGLGVELDRKDVVDQLKADNIDIASLKFDDNDRRQRLGANYTAALSISDVNEFTDIYIQTKENGLDLGMVEGLAVQAGIQRRDGHFTFAGDIYPIGWDFNETDPEKIAAAKNQMNPNILEMADEIRAKLLDDFGLGEGFVSYLLDPRIGLRSATEPFLEFLSQLIDVRNQKSQA